MPDESEKIKSAFEIAMEKVDKLGGLSETERLDLKKKELAEVGEALSRRYLQGLPLRDIDLELGKRADDERRIIVRHLLSRLLDELDMENSANSDRLFPAIRHLSENPDTVYRMESLYKLYAEETAKARQQIWDSLEPGKRKELKERGISGSAVVITIDSSPDWLDVKKRIDERFNRQIQELKQEILQP